MFISKINLNLDKNNFEQLGWGRATDLVNGLEAVAGNRRLMIWGKPGAGKTTFLQHVAIECIEKRFQKNHIPLFK